jgi:hypothetical protein
MWYIVYARDFKIRPSLYCQTVVRDRQSHWYQHYKMWYCTLYPYNFAKGIHFWKGNNRQLSNVNSLDGEILLSLEEAQNPIDNIIFSRNCSGSIKHQVGALCK